MNEPFFSVIIPSFNRLSVLPRAIQSVLTQNFDNFELIIIDDGSTDLTLDYLQSLKDPRIRYFSQENKGVSTARNLAANKSKGQWLAFLDSDDEWLPNKLRLQYDYIQNHSDIPLVHGEEIWIRNGVRVNPKKKHQKSGGDQFARSLELCVISPSATCIKKEVFFDLGLFDEEMEICEDYDLWLRVTSKYQVGFINEPLAKKYGGHEDQLSLKHFAMDSFRIKSIIRLVKSGALTGEQLTKANLVLKLKAEILLKGYQKHGNTAGASWLKELLVDMEH